MQMERCVLLVCVAVYVAACAAGFAAVYILYAYGTVCVTSVWCKVCCCSVLLQCVVALCVEVHVAVFVAECAAVCGWPSSCSLCIRNGACYQRVLQCVCCSACCSVCCGVCCSMQMPHFVFSMHTERCELSACVAVHVAVSVAGCVLYAYGTVHVISVCCSMCCNVRCSVCCSVCSTCPQNGAYY